MWRRFDAEGTTWEVNASSATAAGADRAAYVEGAADVDGATSGGAAVGDDRQDLADDTGARPGAASGRATGAESELLEFRSADPNRPPRRLLVDAGRLARMDDEALRRALRQARPIGGDFYGRPGKHMGDAP